MTKIDIDVAPSKRGFWAEMKTWPARRYWFAVLVTLGMILLVAVPTVLIPNPWFSRDIPPTPWAWPVLIITALLSGLVAATYVARKDTAQTREKKDGVRGSAGALLTFFAVGCPVCNKLALIALGYAGALQYFEPLQPFFAVGAVVLLGYAFVNRVRNESACPINPTKK